MNKGFDRFGTHYPSVSVIIPALNEEENIARCLESIASLNYPADRIEVIVVDNGSTDETRTRAREFHAKVVLSEGLIGAVRNTGGSVASAEVFAFIDADCVAPRAWIAAAIAALREEEIGVVGGICLVDQAESNWVERAWVLNPIPQEKDVEHIATASFIVPREVFCEVGKFNEQVVSGEDMELSSRIRAAGYRLRLLPECTVLHYGYPKSLYGILKRQIWHASSYLSTMKKKRNPVFLLTHLYALNILMFIPASIIFGKFFFFLSICILLAVPIAAVLYKIYRNGCHVTIMECAGAVLIMFVYYIGRSVGLCRAYLSNINRS